MTLVTLIFTLMSGFSLQLSAQQCEANAGGFAVQQLCVQSTDFVLTATPNDSAVVPEGFEVIYVLTSGNDLVIEQVNETPEFKLPLDASGLFTLHTLVYDPATLDLSIVEIGVTTGVDVNGLLIQGGGDICAALDVTGVKFRFGLCDEEPTCEAMAGTLMAEGEACLEEGEATLTAAHDVEPTVPEGFEVIYVLTSGEELTIEQVNAEPTFTVEDIGLFTIHTLVYDPETLDLGIVEIGVTTGVDVNGLLIQGGGEICAALDVAGAQFNVLDCACPIMAGTLVADDDACLEDGEATLTAMHDMEPVVAEGFSVIYVLTSGEELVIEQVNEEPTFTVESTGRFTIHTLVFDPETLDLGIVEIGVTTGVDVNGLLIQGGGEICAALDVAGAQFNVEECEAACEAMAGTLTADDDACLEDGEATLTATHDMEPVVPEGFSLIYVLTSGEELVIEQVNEEPTFTVESTGRFTIHTLVFDPETLDLGIVEIGVTTGVDVNGLLIQGGGEICAALDVAGAQFNVEECEAACEAMAGTLTADDDACLEDGEATLTATHDMEPVVPEGFSLIYVLTSGEELVIEQVNEEPTFTVESTGRFTIHTLVFDPETLDLGIVEIGVTTGVDVNGLLIQGGGDICAALDVAGAQFNVEECDDDVDGDCEATAGTLIADDADCLAGRGGVTLTATRGEEPNVPEGYELLYVLTSGNNLVIQQVGAEPSFDVNTTGRFTIHTLVYDPATLDLSIVELGVTTGVDVNGLLVQGGGDICAALDVAGAQFNVSRCVFCGADAGRISYTRAGGSQLCLDQNNRVILAGNVIVRARVPHGFQRIYVLTSGDELVIQQVNDIPVFEVKETGRYTIHTLVYDPNTLNLGSVQLGTTTGFDINALLIQGGGNICASLDVRGVRFTVRNCGAGRLQAYPNPATNSITLDMPMTDGLENIIVELVDANGTMVKQWRFDGSAAQQTNLNITDVRPGMYVLRITAGDQILQQSRIVKAG
ncbi:MAG TPA: T9SS type A sorting domain-containing protein [Saprospiraceae bacterium]|nr:T9SS type A sorting domain-containing protein [Saprospiraceae bacterium]HMP22533.1 T9SS type A sorting domain-containing protein [Saprospiraceae bacterium]